VRNICGDGALKASAKAKMECGYIFFIPKEINLISEKY